MLIAGPNLTIDRTIRLDELGPGEALRARATVKKIDVATLHANPVSSQLSVTPFIVIPRSGSSKTTFHATVRTEAAARPSSRMATSRTAYPQTVATGAWRQR
jgi:hypothetical protein